MPPPADLAIRNVTPAPGGFDARFSAIWRHYCYRVIGAEDVGVIAVGKRADYLLCGADLSLQTVYLAGRQLDAALAV